MSEITPIPTLTKTVTSNDDSNTEKSADNAINKLAIESGSNKSENIQGSVEKNVNITSDFDKIFPKPKPPGFRHTLGPVPQNRIQQENLSVQSNITSEWGQQGSGTDENTSNVTVNVNEPAAPVTATEKQDDNAENGFKPATILPDATIEKNVVNENSVQSNTTPHTDDKTEAEPQNNNVAYSPEITLRNVPETINDNNQDNVINVKNTENGSNTVQVTARTWESWFGSKVTSNVSKSESKEVDTVKFEEIVKKDEVVEGTTNSVISHSQPKEDNIVNNNVTSEVNAIVNKDIPKDIPELIKSHGQVNVITKSNVTINMNDDTFDRVFSRVPLTNNNNTRRTLAIVNRPMDFTKTSPKMPKLQEIVAINEVNETQPVPIVNRDKTIKQPDVEKNMNEISAEKTAVPVNNDPVNDTKPADVNDADLDDADQTSCYGFEFRKIPYYLGRLVREVMRGAMKG